MQETLARATTDSDTIHLDGEREGEEEYECTAQFFLLFADKKFSDKVRNDLLVTFMIGRISVLFEKLIT